MNVLEVKNVSKRFRIYHEKHETLKEAVLFRKRARYDELWALKDVSFNVKAGETLGVIGENGAGKTTLLKLIARILTPDRGEIAAKGKVSSLLELGAGFEPNLTGRENIYLNGSILGLKRREITAKFDDIVAFSELEKFIDTPVRNYSSGMYMRLGFALAVNVNPDLLLVDEIFAVGDESFQGKCFNKFFDFKSQGKTIVFISHSLETVRKFCDRVIWMDDGKIAADVSASEAIDAYLENVHKKEENIELSTASRVGEHQRWGSREIEILDVEFFDMEGKKRNSFRTGESLEVRVRYKAAESISDPVFGVAIFRNDGLYCYGTNTKIEGVKTGECEGEGVVTLTYDNLALLSGSYVLDVAIFDKHAVDAYDFLSKQFQFKIWTNRPDEGSVYLPHQWTLNREK